MYLWYECLVVYTLNDLLLLTVGGESGPALVVNLPLSFPSFFSSAPPFPFSSSSFFPLLLDIENLKRNQWKIMLLCQILT